MKVPIDGYDCIDLDAPTLPAVSAVRNGRLRWEVWCKHCNAWHQHGRGRGIGKPIARIRQVPTCGPATTWCWSPTMAEVKPLRPQSNSRMAALLVAVSVCLLAMYVAGYFASGRFSRDAIGRFRIYRSSVECSLYRPLARVEAKLSGIPVGLLHEVNDGNGSYWLEGNTSRPEWTNHHD
jgi:hypothetical protein